MMRGLELDDALRHHPTTRLAFKGVYALDHLPSAAVSLPAAFVVNTDKGHKPGEHWVAIYIDAWGVGTYFDSYGLPPLHPLLVTFLQRHTVKWTYSATHVQSVLSMYCGYFAAYFLHGKCRGQSLPRLLRPFRPFQQDINDRIVARWWRRHHRQEQ